MSFTLPTHVIAPLAKLLFVRKVENFENFPKKGGCIISSNHFSYLDGLILGGILVKKRKDIRFFFTEDYFKSRVGKALAKYMQVYWGALAVKGGKGRGKGKEALAEARKALRKGGVIVILPEGHVSSNGQLQKGHTGAARLALWESVPVIPVGIQNNFELFPRHARIPRWWRGRTTVVFGKPLKQKKTSYSYKKSQLLTRKIMGKIAALIGQTYNY